MVEFAPFQKYNKAEKPVRVDSMMNTINEDDEYKEFLIKLETKAVEEDVDDDELMMKMIQNLKTTPLLDAIKNEKQRRKLHSKSSRKSSETSLPQSHSKEDVGQRPKGQGQGKKKRNRNKKKKDQLPGGSKSNVGES
jgi:hypothetical protein